MKKPLWERAIESKYSILLSSLVALIAASPIMTFSALADFYIQSVLFVMIIVGILRVLKAGRALFLVCGLLAFCAILFHYRTLSPSSTRMESVLANLGYLFAVGIALLLMIKRVFAERSVTEDTVKGGLSIYILFGIWWEILYSTIWAFDNGSFSLTAAKHGNPDFFYFSFITLTTLGYGDIVPIGGYARIAATLEAMVGQVYLAVFIARLVGLHIARAGKDGEASG